MRSKTEREIRLAIARIRHGKQKRIDLDRKFSIASVADEAGVSNATIHNRYPALAEHIRKLQKDDAKIVSIRQKTDADELKRQVKDLRLQLQERDNELKRIAIVNLQMAQELKRLAADVANSATDKIVAIGNKKARK